MKWFLILALLLPFVSAAQVTIGKPDCGSYSIDTGATHYPDHLYAICEGSGTTTADEGSGTTTSLTFAATTGAGPDWDTGEATHGTVLDFVAANVDEATNTSVSSLSGTQTVCTVSKITTLNTEYTILQLADSADFDRYGRKFQGADGDLTAQVRHDGSSTTNTSDLATDDSDWNLNCIRFSDSIVDLSQNGGAWDTLGHSETGLVATIDCISIGYQCDTSPDTPLNGEIAAVFWWEASKSDAEISTIYNSGDPWSQVGITTATNSALFRRRRE